MVKVIRQGAYFMEGKLVKESLAFMTSDKKAKAVRNTVSYRILKSHNQGNSETLKLKIDAFVSSDEHTDILQTAVSCGLNTARPYHIISEKNDDETGLSAAKRFGFHYVKKGLTTAAQYAREAVASCGTVLVTSANRVNCGALGALTIYQRDCAYVTCLLDGICEIPCPETVAVFVKGKLRKGVGPHDVALELIRAVSKGDFAKGKILEFFGPGVAGLSVDFRSDIDLTIESLGALGTIWQTDEKTQEYLSEHGRAFTALAPCEPAYYDGGITVDLSRVEPMLALSENEIYTLSEYLAKNAITFDCCALAGSTGGMYENIANAAEIMEGKKSALFVSPASEPVARAISKGGYLKMLTASGATAEGAAQLPPLSGRTVCHAAFAECAGAVIMDARSIAATAANGGKLTSALDYEYNKRPKKYKFNGAAYAKGVFHGEGQDISVTLFEGLTDYPVLAENLILRVTFEADVAINQDELHSKAFLKSLGFTPEEGTRLGSVLVSEKAEGQAKELWERGGAAVIAREYAESYRTDLINRGILPIVCEKHKLKEGDLIVLSEIVEAVRCENRVVAKVISKRKSYDIVLSFPFTAEEKSILVAGGYVNYRKGKAEA